MAIGTAQIAVLGLLSVLLVIAMVTDWRARDIPNWLTAAVAVLAPAWWWASGYTLWPGVGMQIIFCAVVFAIGLGLFAANAMGGGDVKLLAALALWLPGFELLRMIVIMSLIGGALTVAMLVWHRARKREGNPEIPYGLAISAAALWVIAERNLNQFAG